MKKKKHGFRGVYWLVKLIKRFMRDDMPASSAQLTYYLTLAIFPFLVFLINLLSYTKLSTWVLAESLETVLPVGSMQIINSVLARPLKRRAPRCCLFRRCSHSFQPAGP